MFCRKCGAQISGNEKFCPKCGAPVVSVQQASPGMPGSVPQTGYAVPQKKPPYLAIGLIAVIAVVVIVAVRLLFFQSSYETTVKNFMKAIETQDEKLLLSVFPSKVLEEMADEMDMDKEEMEEELGEMFSSLSDEYDGKIRVKYEIEDEHRLKKSQMRNIEDDMYNCIEIKEGKNLEISMELYVDGDKEEEEDMTLRVIKVGRKWYIDPSSF